MPAAKRVRLTAPCETCGDPVFRNGRGELIHVGYMEHAYDHHARIEELHSDS